MKTENSNSNKKKKHSKPYFFVTKCVRVKSSIRRAVITQRFTTECNKHIRLVIYYTTFKCVILSFHMISTVKININTNII